MTKFDKLRNKLLDEIVYVANYDFKSLKKYAEKNTGVFFEYYRIFRHNPYLQYKIEIINNVYKFFTDNLDCFDFTTYKKRELIMRYMFCVAFDLAESITHEDYLALINEDNE